MTRKQQLLFLKFFTVFTVFVILLLPDLSAAAVRTMGERVSTGFVRDGWQATRLLINSFLVIALLVIAFTNITRFNLSSYEIKKALPNLIIGVILANASLLIIRFLLDIVQVAVSFFTTQDLTREALGENNQTFAGLVSKGSGYLLNEASGMIGAGGLFVGNVILAIIGGIIIIIGIVWLSFLLYIRMVVIYFLTIIAPIACVAYGIPGAEGYFKKWFSEFIKWAFMIVIMTAIFWLMVLVMTNMDAEQQSIAKFLIVIALFFAAVTVPMKVGGGLMAKASTGFMQYTGAGYAKKAATDMAINAAKDKGREALSRIPGVYRFQEWKKMRKENFEKRLSQRRAEAKIDVTKGKQGRVAADLEHREGIIADQQTVASASQSVATMNDNLGRDINIARKQKEISENAKKFSSEVQKSRFFTQANNDPTIRELLDIYALSSARSAALAEENESTEKIMTGNYATSRADVLTLVSNIDKLRQERAQLAGQLQNLQAIANNNALTLQQRQAAQASINRHNFIDQLAQDAEIRYNQIANQHEDLSGVSIDDAIITLNNQNSTVGKIWKGEIKRHAQSYNKGIAAQTEDMIKSGSLSQFESENPQLFDGTKQQNIEEAVSGFSILMDPKERRDIDVAITTFKEWAKLRGPQRKEGVVGLLRLLIEQGRRDLIVGNNTYNMHNVGVLIKDIQENRKSDVEMRRLAEGLLQHEAYSGQSSARMNRPPKGP